MSPIQHTKKHNDLVYDVGMHKGEDTDYYIRKGFRVIGFEADPDLAEQCRNKFKNAIENKKLIIVEGAITELPSGETEDKKQKVSFFKNKDNSVWGTVADEWAHRNEILGTSNEIIEVPVVNFSECLNKWGIPHYLKIDIEGMDTLCLKALLHFKEKPDYISIESEKISFDNLLKEIELFTQLGYKAFKAVQQQGISHQKEPNPSKEGEYAGYQFREGSSGLFGADLPGKWKNDKRIINQYKFIFLQYQLFGDYGRLRGTFAGQTLIKILQFFLCKPVPGWYDTHAKHSSVVAS